MMKILFWNVYRLGRTSEKAGDIEAQLDHHFDTDGVEYAFLCEMTSDVELWGDMITKQGVKRKRSKALTRRQLGYAGLDDTGANVALTSMPDLVGRKSKRNVVMTQIPGQVKWFIYHANSSGMASELIVNLVTNIKATYPKESFILFGDMNCEPDELIDELKTSSRDVYTGVRFRSSGASHRRGRTLDWCISYNCRTDVTTKTPVDNPSDHSILIIEV